MIRTKKLFTKYCIRHKGWFQTLHRYSKTCPKCQMPRGNVKNKKAQTGVIVAIIVVAILLIGGGVLFYYLNKQGYFVDNLPEINNSMKLIFQTRNVETQESVQSNFIIYDVNGTIVSQGIVEKDEWREIQMQPLSFMAICWSDNYYLVRATKQLSDLNIKDGVIRFTCDMPKTEHNLQVSHIGELNGQVNQITLNFTATDRLQRAVICPAWTTGFLSVDLQSAFITCDVGLWKNYTELQNGSIDYLPVGQYICSDRIEECIAVEGSSCKSPNQEIPLRLKNKVDYCTYIGKHIQGNVEIPVTVKATEYVTRNDYITFYILDKDRRWNSDLQDYFYYTEFEGKDINALDVNYSINYGENQ